LKMSLELSRDDYTKDYANSIRSLRKTIKKTTHMKNVIELFEMEYLKLTNYSVDLIWPCTTYSILYTFQFNCNPPF
jgi:hypothetical protein